MGIIKSIRTKIEKNRFIFEELVKRDFKDKYKRTVLGILWSMLEPLLHLLVMTFVFQRFFGKETPHYTIYVFSGTLCFSFFRESTTAGMSSLERNANIFSKIKVPKYLFLLSKNVSTLINFALELIIYFLFVLADGLPFTPKFLLLIYPIVCLLLFNLGMGLILSAMHVFFKDVQYLYSILTLLMMYLSATFYTLDRFTPAQQGLFYLNPVYCAISYFRQIVINGVIPPLWHHALCLGYAALVLVIGGVIYYRKNNKFIYYI